jgi:abequosyltransferase
MSENITLSIAIPTYNRALWLKLCLEQLLPQVAAIGKSVEVTVYDNASPDHTPQVVESFIENGFPLKYFRNSDNIGSDRNIAQCFNLSNGKYVHILGDDDVYLDGALQKILALLSGDFGAVFISAYGFDSDFIKERPTQILAQPLNFFSMDPFVKKCSTNAAFISSIIINRDCILDVNAEKFVGTALVQTFLLYESISRNQHTIFIQEYLIGAKRIDNRDYNVVDIFSRQFNKALQYLVDRGLAASTVKAINRKILWYFLPMHLINLRTSNTKRQKANEAYIGLYKIYRHDPFFWLCSMPILKFPVYLARFWGYALIILGRIINGEFGRLWVAMREKMLRKSEI